MDILIKNGLVVDGTGNPGFYAGVGVQGENISVFRGDYSHIEALRVIDATGKVVCPGFIDMHAHTGLVILAEPEHHPKVRQGITTELVGVDGNSYAPFTSHDDFLDFVELNSGLDGAPPLPGHWSTVAEYLSMFDNKVAVNIAYVIGNSPIRICAMGWDEKPATDADLANMRAMMREGLEEGAFGLSTGLDYPPGSYADTDELVSLAEEAARLGGIYHTHLRNTLGDRFLDPVKEALEIGQRAALPCHLTHFYQRITHPGSAPSAPGPSRGVRRLWAGRDHGLLSLRVQQHPGVDPDSPVGPQRRPEKAERGPAFRGGTPAPAGGGPCSGHRVMERPLADVLQASPQSEVRGTLRGRGG